MNLTVRNRGKPARDHKSNIWVWNCGSISGKTMLLSPIVCHENEIISRNISTQGVYEPSVWRANYNYKY